jgi:nucleotide-binding universal stress UspA family protein
MGYKTIAVHVNESRHSPARIELAAAIAVQHDAHLIGVATSALPQAFYMPGLVGESGAALNTYLDFMKKRALTALTGFDGLAQRAGVATFERSLMEDETGGALCLQARYSDLLIIGQNDPDEVLPEQRPDVPQYVITHSPRPILIIPYAGRFNSIGNRAVIAWDGSTEATRAVAASLPFLKQARTVQVVVFNADRDPYLHGEQPGADIALYLARHGVNVEVLQRSAAEDADIGNALLSHLADHDADLLVMGGYGHSRIREVLLGGVTRTVLQSMTAPVLMSH